MRFKSLLALAVILGGAFALPITQSAPPIDPPGPAQVIEPVIEVVVPPAVDDEVVIPPPPFSIAVEIEGKLVTEEIVLLPANKLAYLRVVGPEVLPSAGKKLPMAQWTRNQPIANWRQHDVVYSLADDGEVIVGYDHAVSMAGDDGVAHLIQVAVSNADPIKPPHIAQRWIVSGKGPQPPPGPGPGPGPEPKPPVVTTGAKQVYVVYEEDDLTIDQSEALNELRLDPYLKSRGHSLRFIDDDATDSDGTKDDALEKLAPHITPADEPLVIIVDKVTQAFVDRATMKTSTSQDVMNYLKGKGL